MVYHSGRDIHLVTPEADAAYQVIGGLGQAGLPPLWLAFLGNHYRSLETALHEAPVEAPNAMIGSEETLSADSEATLSANSESTLSINEETISAEEDVTMRELEQERQNLQVKINIRSCILNTKIQDPNDKMTCLKTGREQFCHHFSHPKNRMINQDMGTLTYF